MLRDGKFAFLTEVEKECRGDPNSKVSDFFKKKENRELTVNSLKAFGRNYEYWKKSKESGAKFSERIFTYWIIQELKTRGFKEARLRKRYDVPIRIPTGNGKTEEITKVIDFCFIDKDGKEIYIEYKCNIDLVEKDLYKFYLIKRYKEQKPTTVLLIWEIRNNWNDKKKNEPSQCANLLINAKAERILDEYFYLPISDKNKLREQVFDFKRFIESKTTRQT